MSQQMTDQQGADTAPNCRRMDPKTLDFPRSCFCIELGHTHGTSVLFGDKGWLTDD